MNKKGNNEYLVLFQGAKLSKREANKVGTGIIFGVVGMLGTFLFPIGQTKIINYTIILIFAAIGYFLIGNKIFRKKGKGKQGTSTSK